MTDFEGHPTRLPLAEMQHLDDVCRDLARFCHESGCIGSLEIRIGCDGRVWLSVHGAMGAYMAEHAKADTHEGSFFIRPSVALVVIATALSKRVSANRGAT